MAVAGSAAAQTTWRGLRFGMTEAEARTQLGNDAKRPSGLGAESNSKSEVYTGWLVSLELQHIPGEARIGFDKKAHRCAGIYIELDPTKIIDGIEKQVSVKLLLESLENKYGHPFRIEDGVQGSKTITWRTSDQIVEYHCISVEGVPHLIIIRYEPKTKDL
jgi:hypothetical protein